MGSSFANRTDLEDIGLNYKMKSCGIGLSWFLENDLRWFGMK
jgi:hypothetical protein